MNNEQSYNKQLLKLDEPSKKITFSTFSKNLELAVEFDIYFEFKYI